ncbi:uncharacterized protein M6B38_398655 [Iris pallida]|uniref:DNA-(apurinic or apyrimidinic site) lyase n=1 Tax=Iris pallida TaxID=29817 RepID=A0AAX6FU82_IRIPA|nr:uncharacterized protein M6B38_398655 [Iris pallida]
MAINPSTIHMTSLPSIPSSSPSPTMPKRPRLTPPPQSTPPPQNPNPKIPLIGSKPKPKPETRRSLTPSLVGSSSDWTPLPIPISELSLPLTLPTGQSFRWRRTSADVFTGPIGPHLLSFRHASHSHLSFLHHNPNPNLLLPAVRSAIDGYFNVHVGLAELWREFAAADERFAELAGRAGGGARVLRQDPVECLFQFLCSSNNNIKRIEKMVEVLASYGEYLGNVGGVDFYEFPTVERLAEVREEELRQAGFGYRAKYVVGTVKALQAKPGGGAQWLASLRGLELSEVIDSLCTLPGVGPKVAACIALFSLDQHHAIPVDTHVWQIATRYLLPELAGSRLTQKLCSQVSEAFVSRFGKYAGWAQTLLFIGELPSQKVIVDIDDETKSTKRKRGIKKVAELVLLESG